MKCTTKSLTIEEGNFIENDINLRTSSKARVYGDAKAYSENIAKVFGSAKQYAKIVAMNYNIVTISYVHNNKG
jgi:hypothetical protein